jgi:internalin A
MSNQNQVNTSGTGSIRINQKNIHGDKVMGDKIMGDNVMGNKIVNQQNFNGPMSGVIASDNAQVSNNQFIQNNANTAELLQLITTLRQTATTFPKDIQDELTIDIDDVETELQKPEPDRNPTKLKKRLLALATAGALIASPIAGMTDFANTAIDLAGKLNIELPIP